MKEKSIIISRDSFQFFFIHCLGAFCHFQVFGTAEEREINTTLN